jgi:hypothetical protein
LAAAGVRPKRRTKIMARKALTRGEQTRSFSFVLPKSLYLRLVRQASKETADTEVRVSPGELCRAAIEEYLDLYEGAAFEKKEGVR